MKQDPVRSSCPVRVAVLAHCLPILYQLVKELRLRNPRAIVYPLDHTEMSHESISNLRGDGFKIYNEIAERVVQLSHDEHSRGMRRKPAGLIYCITKWDALRPPSCPLDSTNDCG